MKMKNKKIENLGLFIQVCLIICMGIISIVAVFLPDLFVVTEIFLGITLLVMAYNNYTVVKRKYATYIYFVAGIVSFVASMIAWFNAI